MLVASSFFAQCFDVFLVLLDEAIITHLIMASLLNAISHFYVSSESSKFDPNRTGTIFDNLIWRLIGGGS